MASRPDPPADPAFEDLCRLLAIPTGRRSLANYVKIGRHVAALCGGPTGPDPEDEQGARLERLRNRLRVRGVKASVDLLRRYRRLGEMNANFQAAVRGAKRATWEHVRLLLGDEHAAVRDELLALLEAQPKKIPVNVFQQVVHLRTVIADEATRPTAAGRTAFKAAARRLQETAVQAAGAARPWEDGPAAAGLVAVAGRDLVAAGQVWAAVREFQAAAARLAAILGREATRLGTVAKNQSGTR